MDPTDVIPVFSDAAKIGIGGFVVWLFTSGQIHKFVAYWREGRKEVREEAQEAPERELQVVKEQLLEYKLTLKGVIAELNEMREHNKNCEVNQARQQAKIEMQDCVIAELREENAELKSQIQSLQKQAGVWRQVQVDVQAIQEHQDQQDHGK